MLGHGGSSVGSYLADSTSPIPSHCAVITVSECLSASIVVTSTARVKFICIVIAVIFSYSVIAKFVLLKS